MDPENQKHSRPPMILSSVDHREESEKAGPLTNAMLRELCMEREERRKKWTAPASERKARLTRDVIDLSDCHEDNRAVKVAKAPISERRARPSEAYHTDVIDLSDGNEDNRDMKRAKASRHPDKDKQPTTGGVEIPSTVHAPRLQVQRGNFHVGTSGFSYKVHSPKNMMMDPGIHGVSRSDFTRLSTL